MKPIPRSVATEISFALSAAANRMARLHKPFLEPLGLTFSQYLVTLELLNGSPRAVSDLCDRLDMEIDTLTPLLKRLEAVGVIMRKCDGSNERRVLFDLTEPVRAMQNELRNVTENIRIACQCTPEDLEDLCRRLEGFVRPASS